MKKNKSKNKFIKVSLVALTLGSAFSAIIFGIVNYSIKPEIFEISNEYQNKYETEIKVNWNSNNKDIDSVAKNLYERLDFYGYENGVINIINEDTLSVVMPVTSFDNKTDDMWSVLTEEELSREVTTFQTSLTQKQNIEFRHHDGTQLFDLVNGQIKFIEPEEPDPPEEKVININENYEDFYQKYEIQLLSDARVSYNNGIPFVEVKPKNSNILQEFRTMGRTLPSHLNPESNPRGNTVIVWFGYEELIWRAETMDYDQFAQANFDPLTYTFTDSLGNTTSKVRQSAESNYVATWEIGNEFSIHEEWIPINSQLTQQQALNVVSSIKFANLNFDLDIISTNLILNEETLKSNSWFIWVFVALILLAGFFMVWWNGLLGMIAASSSLLTLLSLIGFTILYGLPLTSGLILAMSFITLSTFFINNLIIKNIKASKNKNLKPGEKSKDYYKYTYNKTSLLFIILIILLSAATFFMPSKIALVIFMSLLGILIFIGITYFISIPIFILMDSIFKYTYKKHTKWDFMIGVPYKEIYLDNAKTLNKLATPNISKNLSIIAIGLSIAGIMLFGIMSLVGAGGINSLPINNNYYQYDIILSQRLGEDDIEEIEDELDPYNQKEIIKSIKNDKTLLLDTLKDYGISSFSNQIVRNDNHFLWKLVDPDGDKSEEFDYDFAYGISIQSLDEIKTDDINDINQDLSNIGDGYELAEKSSLSEINNISKYSQYTKTNDRMIIILGIVGTLFLTLAFIFIYFKWSGSIAVLGSIIIESSLAFALTVAFWTPWTSMFWIGLLIVIGFSLISKTISESYMKKKIVMTKKTEKEEVLKFNKEYVNKSLIPTLILMSLIMTTIIISSFIIPSAIGALTIIIVGLIIVTINNTIIYPNFSSSMYKIRKNSKDRKQLLDEQYSLNKDTIDEEYIKGINK